MNERVIFDAALEIADPQARRAFVEKACAGNPGLLVAVESLLKSHDAAGSFLDIPAAEQIKGGVPGSREDSTAAVEKTRRYQAGDADDDDSDDDRQPDLSFLQPSSKPGSIGVLAHYEVLQVLGQGAFGIVLKAFDEKLLRLVAIKVMNPQLAATSPPRKRFLREARAAAAIRHENVVQVYSVDEQPLPYLVMEFIDGQTLKQKLDSSGPLETPEVLHIGRQIASGLAAAQAMGLIHRDIKPGNILLEGSVAELARVRTGGEPDRILANSATSPIRVKISDFGLARAADDASLTRTGVISGTPMYMAPEQATGQPLDHRADLFSLGSVLYQMACGRPPFRAATTVAVLRRVVEDTPRPLQEILPEIPDWLVAIVTKLHAKKPEDRFQSAKEVADVLTRCQSELQLTGKVTCVPVAESLRDSKKIDDSPATTGPANSQASRAASASGVSRDAASVRGLMPNGGTGQVSGTALAAGSSPAKSTPRDTTIPVASAIPLTATEAVPVRRRSIPKSRVVIALGGVLLMLLAAVVYRIQIDQGTLVVTIDDPAVQAILEQDGLVIRDKHSDRTWTIKATESQPLPSGEYQLKLGQQLFVTDESGAELKTDTFALKRNGEFRVRVTLDQAARVADKKPATSDPDRRAAEWVLSIGGGIKIKVNGEEREIKTEGNLPLGTFELTLVDLNLNEQVSDAGLAHFKDCKNLTHLDLFHARLSDAGLAHFENCKNLTHLNLGRTQVSDAGLAHFKDCKNLTELILDQTKVSHAGLAQFKGCKNLKILHLDYTGVGDAGLAHFKDCKNFTQLNLDNTGVSDAGLAHLKDCKNFIYVVLSGSKVSDAGLGHFEDCQKLTVLWLDHTQVSDAGLEHLAACSKLGSLTLHGNRKVTEAGVKKVSGALPGCRIVWDGGVIEPRPTDPDRHAAEYVLSIGGNIKIKDNGQEREIKAEGNLPRGAFELTGVTLGNNPKVSDEGLAHFKDIRNLTFLDLGGLFLQVSDAGLAHFGNCKNLTLLSLGSTRVSDAGLAHFRDCNNLTHLNLESSQVSDAGLAHFQDCKNLTLLHLEGTPVGDAGVAHFKDCKNLTSLKLNGTRVSDAGLAHFRDCKNLTLLTLDSTRVSDVGLAILKDCKNLRHLDLNDTQVSDARLADLSSLPNLTSLGLANTRVSLNGHKQLKAARPKCGITWSEANRSVAETVLALGGSVEIGSLDQPDSRPVQAAGDLPGDYFQVRRVSLAGVTKPLDPLRPLLAWLTFPQFDRLESIDLSDSTGLDYSFLVPIHGLRELTLANAGLNDVSLAILPKLPTLQRLVLDGNDIRGSGLTHFSKQPELIDLSLSHPNLTNLSAENLAELKRLKRLSLAGSGLTNTGIKHLANLTNLESLDLRRTKVTAAGIDELKSALPKCQIQWDGMPGK